MISCDVTIIVENKPNFKISPFAFQNNVFLNFESMSADTPAKTLKEAYPPIGAELTDTLGNNYKVINITYEKTPTKEDFSHTTFYYHLEQITQL